MFCYACQARNNETNQFCTSCGTRLAPPSPEQVREARPVRLEDSGSPEETAAYGGGSYLSGSYDNRTYQNASSDGGLSGSAFGSRSLVSMSGGDRLARSHYSEFAEQRPGDRAGSNGMGVVPYQQPYQQPFPSHYQQPFPQPYSGSYLNIAAITCSGCGMPRASRLETCPHCGRRIVNDSGSRAAVPAELASGWNWGAFFFPVLWGISHETWFGLLGIMPGLNIVVSFVLGARGNELAWQNRRFQSVEHYQHVQQVWRNCSLGIVAIAAALFMLYAAGLAG